MSRAVFAANKIHALAMIQWLDLERTLWHASAYGDHLRDHYDEVILVRPISGVTREHFVWISVLLVPRMRTIDDITILHWHYGEFPGFDKEDAILKVSFSTLISHES